MRKINFIEPSHDEAWTKWRAKCEKETERLIKCHEEGTAIRIKDDLYKEQKDYYKNKTAPFFGKCSYCETEFRHHDDLDHYRPKKIVTDENDVKIDHPGYFWLAYLWNNLFPVCKECNSTSVQGGERIGKQNRFPVKGMHAISPGDEGKEEPLLLNPIVDSPEDHLEWDQEEKLIVARPGDEKGQMTIKILGFHQREQLRENWVKAYDQTFLQLLAKLMDGRNSNNGLQQFEEYKNEIQRGEVKFSFVANAAFKELQKAVNS